MLLQKVLLIMKSKAISSDLRTAKKSSQEQGICGQANLQMVHAEKGRLQRKNYISVLVTPMVVTGFVFLLQKLLPQLKKNCLLILT